MMAMEEHERVSGSEGAKASSSTPERTTSDGDADDAVGVAGREAPDEWIERLRRNVAERDFTTNSLMYDVGTRTLYDFAGGIDDIAAGVIRTIGDAAEGFKRDPGRMVGRDARSRPPSNRLLLFLWRIDRRTSRSRVARARGPYRTVRAVRVTARHDLRPSSELVAALRTHAHLLETIPTARASMELLTVLSCGYAARATRMMWECGMLPYLMPAHAEYVAKAIARSNGPSKTRRAAPGHDAAAFERDALFRLLAALDDTCSPQAPASEEMVYACLAAALAVDRVGWPVPPHPADVAFDDPELKIALRAYKAGGAIAGKGANQRIDQLANTIDCARSRSLARVDGDTSMRSRRRRVYVSAVRTRGRFYSASPSDPSDSPRLGRRSLRRGGLERQGEARGGDVSKGRDVGRRVEGVV